MKNYILLSSLVLFSCQSNNSNEAEKKRAELNRQIDQAQQETKFMSWRSDWIKTYLMTGIHLDSAYKLTDSMAKATFFKDSIPSWYRSIQESQNKIIDSMREERIK